MKKDKKIFDELEEKDVSNISIERIRQKNAEFVNLNRIFANRSRKLKEILAETESEIEREL